ncbi:MAG: hypothetical protein ACI835_005932 [Planctomycetota bacterium]|jgi:hypothetical protein
MPAGVEAPLGQGAYDRDAFPAMRRKAFQHAKVWISLFARFCETERPVATTTGQSRCDPSLEAYSAARRAIRARTRTCL